MRSLKLAISSVSALALMGVVAPLQARAQTAPAPAAASPTVTDEIVVTTRRASESLEKVPLAISVTTADQLQTRGITDLQTVAQYTPNFSFKEFITSFHGNPTIRGMAQVNTSSAITNAGVFYDGVYLQRDYQENQTLGDFERIELVKGPQSALYGANTFSGAVNYVTRAPTDEFTGNGEVTAGNAGEQRYEVAAGGPIVKGILDGRIYAGSDKYDGTWRNNTPGIEGPDRFFGGHNRTAESISLKFTPTDYLTFNAVYMNSHREEQIRPFYTLSGKFSEDKTNCGVVNASTGRPSLFCGQFPTSPKAFLTGVGNEPAPLFANVEPNTLNDNQLFKFGADWVINSAFTAHYLFGETKGSASEDNSFFANTYNPVTQPAVANSFSQQIEGGRLSYTSHEVRLNYDDNKPYKLEIGYAHSDSADHYFLGIKSVAITGGVLPPFTRASNDPLYAPPGTIFLSNLAETFKTDSVFGRGSYSFLDNKATVSAEFRYTRTDLKIVDVSYSLTHPTAAPLTATYNDPIPRFTAQYQITPNNQIYASAAEGIKTGGFNGYASGTLTLVPGDQSFGEEKNWTYEFGAKNVFLDHKLIVNADIFYIDWFQKLAQLTPVNLPPQTSGALTTVASIYKIGGGAKNYGLEADIQYKPITKLTLAVSGALQNPTYNSGAINTAFIGYCTVGTCPVNGSIAGNQLERVSKYSSAFSAEYHDHLAADWDYFGGAEVTYQSKQYTDQENLGSIAGYALMNGQIGVQNDRWKAFFWAKNIFDQAYVADVFYTQTQAQYTASFGERRTFGVTLAGRF